MKTMLYAGAAGLIIAGAGMLENHIMLALMLLIGAYLSLRGAERCK